MVDQSGTLYGTTTSNRLVVDMNAKQRKSWVKNQFAPRVWRKMSKTQRNKAIKLYGRMETLEIQFNNAKYRYTEFAKLMWKV